MKLNPFKGLADKRRQEAPVAPKVAVSAWRPPTNPVLPETPREKFLRERSRRRRAVNRTKNKLAHAARRENWHG
jgi:hypothetical protein